MNPITIRRRSLALVLAATTPFALLSCSDDGAEQAEIESSAEATTEQSTSSDDGSTDDGSTDDGSTDDGGSDESTTTASEDDAGPAAPAPDDGEVLGSSTGNHPASPNDDTLVPLQLDVRGIERMDGDIVEVRFSITNTGTDATYELWSTISDPAFRGAYDVGGAALLDPPNDKRYLTLYDSADTCLCTADAINLAVGPGDTLDLYAQLPAPPEDVTEITFTLPGFEPVDGLTIQ